MLIVFRVLGGGAAASVQAVGAGTIADLWLPFERGRAMGAWPSALTCVTDQLTWAYLLIREPQAYSTSAPSPARSSRPS